MIGSTTDKSRNGRTSWNSPLWVPLQILRTGRQESCGHLPQRLMKSRRAHFVFGIDPADDISDLSRKIPRPLLRVVPGNHEVVVRVCCPSVRLVVPEAVSIEVGSLRAAWCRVHDIG